MSSCVKGFMKFPVGAVKWHVEGDPLECDLLVHFRMNDSKPVELDPYHHVYALSCFGWKCLVCSIEAKDQIGFEMAWLGDENVVYTDGIDGSKWVCCNGCQKCFHLSCVTGDTEEQVEAKG